MSQPLRVLFVAGSLGGGGAERRLVDLLRNLDPNRIAPRLYLAYRQGELLGELPESIPVEAFDDSRSPRSFGQRWLAKLRCPSRARAWHLREVLDRSPVDAVVSWSLLSSYEVALARQSRPIPQLACSVVEPRAEVQDAFPHNPWRSEGLARWTYHAANLVLTNSAELRDQVQACYGLPPEHVETWLSTRDFNRVDQLAMQDSPTWPDVGRRVIAAGRLTWQKGFDVLLRAVAKVHSSVFPVQVTILGQGPLEQSLRHLSEYLGIAGQVRWLGFQANPYAYFRSSEVFVLPSRFEGMPNALIEAVACRVPVIAADCPTGPKEILEQGRWGKLIPMDNVEALATALKAMLESTPPSRDLEAARQSVLDRFGMAAGIRRLEELLQKVIAAESKS